MTRLGNYGRWKAPRLLGATPSRSRGGPAWKWRRKALKTLVPRPRTHKIWYEGAAADEARRAPEGRPEGRPSPDGLWCAATSDEPAGVTDFHTQAFEIARVLHALHGAGAAREEIRRDPPVVRLADGRSSRCVSCSQCRAARRPACHCRFNNSPAAAPPAASWRTAGA